MTQPLYQQPPQPDLATAPRALKGSRLAWIGAGLIAGLLLGLCIAPQPKGAVATFTYVSGGQGPDLASMRARYDRICWIIGLAGGPLVGAAFAVFLGRRTSLHWLLGWLLVCGLTAISIGCLITLFNLVTPEEVTRTISPDPGFALYSPALNGVIVGLLGGLITGGIAAAVGLIVKVLRRGRQP